MPKFNAALDLARSELRNAITQNLATAPPPAEGLRYYDTVLKYERYWNGTAWVDSGGPLDASLVTGLGALALLNQVGTAEIAPGSVSDSHIAPSAAINLSKLAVDPLARANHTGTQLASTISDFDPQVRTSRLDQMAIPTAPLDLGGQTITNLASPSAPSDAANKTYVDSMAAGIDIKSAVRLTSTGNVDRAAPGTDLDGVTMAIGDRILLKNQTAPAENGIYVFNGGSVPLVRAPDADTDGEVNTGMYVLTTAGLTNLNTGWMLSTPNPITVDTTPLTFSQFSAGGSQYTGTAGRITVTGNQIDIASNYLGQPSISTVGTVTAGTWQGTPIDILYGGTGATTASGARINLGVPGKYSRAFPNATEQDDGTKTSFTVDHGLNLMTVTVELYEAATGQTVYADVTRVDGDNVRIDGFTQPPAVGTLQLVVTG